MSSTPNLQLPEFGAIGVPSGSELTRGMRRLDAVVQASAIAFSTAAPDDAALGDRYIVSSPAVGAFFGWERRLACLMQDGWNFFTPEHGWKVVVGSPPITYVYDATSAAWELDTPPPTRRMVGATWARSTGQIETPTFDVDVRAPVDGQVVAVSVVTQGGPGDAVLDIWVDDLHPPTNVDSICGASKPTLTNDTVYEDETLTGWDLQFSQDDWIRFHLESSTDFSLITIQLFFLEIT